MVNFSDKQDAAQTQIFKDKWEKGCCPNLVAPRMIFSLPEVHRLAQNPSMSFKEVFRCRNCVKCQKEHQPHTASSVSLPLQSWELGRHCCHCLGSQSPGTTFVLCATPQTRGTDSSCPQGFETGQRRGHQKISWAFFCVTGTRRL